MRGVWMLFLASAIAVGQSSEAPRPAEAPAQTQTQSKPDVQSSGQNPAQADGASAAPTTAPEQAKEPAPVDPNTTVIPAGSKIPLSLQQAISTKNAREGDAVYAATAFPFVVNERILVPAGTYIQGKIVHTQPAGRSRKRAEILIHFTSMIYPSGYTVMLPGSVDNTPGADNKGVKDQEGTIQQDSGAGKRVEDAAKGAAVGGTAGSIAGVAAGGYNGARIGGAAGLAGGIAWALLKHGPELRLDVGTSIEMEIQRDVPVDMSRITLAKASP